MLSILRMIFAWIEFIFKLKSNYLSHNSYFTNDKYYITVVTNRAKKFIEIL